MIIAAIPIIPTVETIERTIGNNALCCNASDPFIQSHPIAIIPKLPTIIIIARLYSISIPPFNLSRNGECKQLQKLHIRSTIVELQIVNGSSFFSFSVVRRGIATPPFLSCCYPARSTSMFRKRPIQPSIPPYIWEIGILPCRTC